MANITRETPSLSTRSRNRLVLTRARSPFPFRSSATSICLATTNPHSGWRSIRATTLPASSALPTTNTRCRYQLIQRTWRRGRLRNARTIGIEMIQTSNEGRSWICSELATVLETRKNQLHAVETRKTVASSSESVILRPLPME